jgi:hypothetical protein
VAAAGGRQRGFGDDVRGVVGVDGEVAAQGVTDLAGGGAGGQHPVIGDAPAHVQERGAEGDQDQHHRQGGEHRPPGHGGGGAAPERRPGPPQPGALADRPGIHPRSQHGEQGGQHEQGGDDRDDDHADPGVGERAQEVHGKHQQGGQGGGDRAGGKDDRAAGGGDAPADGGGRAGSGGQFLAVAVDHQQRVVDAQTQAQRGGQVEGVDADRGQAGQHVQDGQRRDDGQQPDGHRQQRRDHGAERQDEQGQRDRDGDFLGPGQAGVDLLGDRGVGGGLAAGAHGDRAGRARRGGQLGHQGFGPGGHGRVAALHGAQHQGLAAGAAAQRGIAGRPVRADAGDPGGGGQPGGEPPAGRGDGRGAGAAVPRGDQQHQVGLPAEVRGQAVGGEHGRRVRAGEPLGLQLGRGADGEQRGQRGQHCGDHQDRLRAASGQLAQVSEHDSFFPPEGFCAIRQPTGQAREERAPRPTPQIRVKALDPG